jgi:hypothetical protein
MSTISILLVFAGVFAAGYAWGYSVRAAKSRLRHARAHWGRSTRF